MDAKPIFIIRSVAGTSQEELTKVQINVKNILTDYHVFVILGSGTQAEFECYNSKEADQIDIEKLKELICQEN